MREMLTTHFRLWPVADPQKAALPASEMETDQDQAPRPGRRSTLSGRWGDQGGAFIELGQSLPPPLISTVRQPRKPMLDFCNWVRGQ